MPMEPGASGPMSPPVAMDASLPHASLRRASRPRGPRTFTARAQNKNENMTSTGSASAATVQGSPSPGAALRDSSTAGTAPGIHGPQGRAVGAVPLSRLRWAVFALVGFACALGLAAMVVAARSAARDDAAGALRLESERLARTAMQAADGVDSAFAAVRGHVEGIDAAFVRLGVPGAAAEVAATTPTPTPTAAELAGQWAKMRRTLDGLLAEQAGLVEITSALRLLIDRDADLFESAEQVVQLLAQAGAPAREQAGAARLVLLTQRIAKNANRLLASATIDAEAAYGLARDAAASRETLRALIDGNEAVRQAALRLPALRRQLDALREDFDAHDRAASVVVGRQQNVARARASARDLAAGAGVLAAGAEHLQASHDAGRWRWLALGAAAVAALIGAVALALLGGRRRTMVPAAVPAALPVVASPDPQAQHLLDLARRIRELHGSDVTAQPGDDASLARGVADWIGYATLEMRELASALEQSRTDLRVLGDETLARAAELVRATEERAATLAGLTAAAAQAAHLGETVAHEAAAGGKTAARCADAASFGAESARSAIQILHGVHGRSQECVRHVQGVEASLQDLSTLTADLARGSTQLEVAALNIAIRAGDGGGQGGALLAGEVERYAQRAAESVRQLDALIGRCRAECQRASGEILREAELLREQTCVADDTLQSLLNLERNARELAGHVERIAAATSQQRAFVGSIDEGAALASAQAAQVRERAGRIAETAGALAHVPMGPAAHLPGPPTAR